jgi:hypothetical protein
LDKRCAYNLFRVKAACPGFSFIYLECSISLNVLKSGESFMIAVNLLHLSGFDTILEYSSFINSPLRLGIKYFEIWFHLLS